MVNRARALRRQSTDAEEWLWSVLRGRRLEGAKFRRQHPMGPYIVDFFCPDVRLIIELDGSGHHVRAESDAQRTSFLQRTGNRVLRIWNNDVTENPEGVIECILDALRTPHPNPLPQGARGQVDGIHSVDEKQTPSTTLCNVQARNLASRFAPSPHRGRGLG
ncbi:MAG: endonuclease domain-containing protein [Chloroflexi bacterium]|nr:endonuclease domain-containing protein [Chloroflexota bacterium]